MTDQEGQVKEVKLYKSKPQDFEKSETIVLIGEAKGNEFHANDILMKCPSKYEGDTQVSNQVN
jgi:cytochrome c-type biogenesis protein CcmE